MRSYYRGGIVLSRGAPDGRRDLSARREAETGKNIVNMIFHRAGPNLQLTRNRRVRQPSRDAERDLALPRGERCERRSRGRPGALRRADHNQRAVVSILNLYATLVGVGTELPRKAIELAPRERSAKSVVHALDFAPQASVGVGV
jgi:hypothetical protein